MQLTLSIVVCLGRFHFPVSDVRQWMEGAKQRLREHQATGEQGGCHKLNGCCLYLLPCLVACPSS